MTCETACKIFNDIILMLVANRDNQYFHLLEKVVNAHSKGNTEHYLAQFLNTHYKTVLRHVALADEKLQEGLIHPVLRAMAILQFSINYSDRVTLF